MELGISPAKTAAALQPQAVLAQDARHHHPRPVQMGRSGPETALRLFLSLQPLPLFRVLPTATLQCEPTPSALPLPVEGVSRSDGEPFNRPSFLGPVLSTFSLFQLHPQHIRFLALGALSSSFACFTSFSASIISFHYQIISRQHEKGALGRPRCRRSHLSHVGGLGIDMSKDSLRLQSHHLSC